MSFQKFADDVQQILLANTEWQDRYEKYDCKTKQNFGKIFQVNKPIFRYTTISNETKKQQTILRCHGQEIAFIKATNGNVELEITETHAHKTNKHFENCGVSPNFKAGTYAWNSKEATRYRSFFKKNPKKHGHPEHTLESALLTELERTKATGKSILNIQPVVLNTKRFQMPTPLKASNVDNITYAKQHGGGIDILARHGIGRSTKLCVVELKDENKPKEPPEIAIKQAIAYAVFVRQLLRCQKSNPQKWWKLFGFRRELPEKLVINCVVAMPGISNAPRFVGEKILLGNDELILHYMSVDIANGKIVNHSLK